MKFLPQNKKTTLIFGTSPDYVKRISLRYGFDTLFIVDIKFKGDANLKDLDSEAILFTDLDDTEICVINVTCYLKHKNISPSGIGCFDCESLIAASRLAMGLDLPFPPVDGISKARNKFESKRIWNNNDIACPKVSITRDLQETITFFRDIQNSIVVKPLSGSGSELTFYCQNENEIVDAVDIISRQLGLRNSNPLFKRLPGLKGSKYPDPLIHWVLEEYIDGPEFSCDFILQGDLVTIIRLTEKIKDNEQAFGSILAYCIPADLPNDFSRSELSSSLKKAVTSLGLDHGWFMVDFIVHNKEPYIIEITPRPGGDSIPDLIETATGEDILGIYLDFITGRKKEIKPIEYNNMPLASLNLYAPKAGIITELDTSGIKELPWIKTSFILKKVNDIIILPPYDYDSRKIGHCIIHTGDPKDLKQRQQLIMDKIQLIIKDPDLDPFIKAGAEMSIR